MLNQDWLTGQQDILSLTSWKENDMLCHKKHFTDADSGFTILFEDLLYNEMNGA